jgi:hypothetical protein
MGDKIIITDDEEKPSKPDVIVVAPEGTAKKEKVVTEKTVVTETKEEQ